MGRSPHARLQWRFRDKGLLINGQTHVTEWFESEINCSIVTLIRTVDIDTGKEDKIIFCRNEEWAMQIVPILCH